MDDWRTLFLKKEFDFEDIKLPYRIYIPENYCSDKKYPLLLSMHGLGECGCDNEIQIAKWYSPFERIFSSNYECIMVAPQCPKGDSWIEQLYTINKNNDVSKSEPRRILLAVKALLDDIKIKYNIDFISSFGYSMGGGAVLELAARYNNYFKSIVSVCPAEITMEASSSFKDTKLWLFHSNDDGTVPVEYTRLMDKTLSMLGIYHKSTYYDGLGHGSWVKAYQEPELLDFIF